MSHDDVDVGLLRPSERHHVVAATSRAFWPDPVFGFFARDPLHEHRAEPSFFGALVDDARRHGEVWVARRSGEVAGAAAWVPPGGMPRGALRELRVTGAAVGTLVTGRNRRRAIALLREVERRHPTEPHWYLGLLGVDPRWQRRGLGGRLLAPVLERCDEDGLPAYLETQKPENIVFYDRFGFAVVDEVHLDGTPPMWRLWRDPRPPDTSPRP